MWPADRLSADGARVLALATQKPGDRVPVRISRNGTQSTVTVTLGSLTS
jgi:S1-C subfamily serine protease